MNDAEKIVASEHATSSFNGAIWHTVFSLDEANCRGRTCAPGHLGIELIEAGDDYLKAAGTHQVLHEVRALTD